MASRGTEIHALQEKMRIFAELLFEAGLIDSKSNQHLAARLNSRYETLKSAWREGRMSDDLIEECVKLGRFKDERHYFVDPNVPPKDRSRPPISYPGRDTVDSFRAMLLRTLEISPVSTRIHGKPQIRNRNIAWFQIDDAGQARVQGSVTELFLAVGLETVEFEDILIGISDVRIRISLQTSSDARAGRLMDETLLSNSTAPIFLLNRLTCFRNGD